MNTSSEWQPPDGQKLSQAGEKRNLKPAAQTDRRKVAVRKDR
jgi:hypothetical protein